MKKWTKQARYSRDPTCNMGYISLGKKLKGQTWHTIVVHDGQGKTLFALDVNGKGRIMGIECFDAEAQLGR